MDPRIVYVRECVRVLRGEAGVHGGDRMAACLQLGTHHALELCAEMLALRGAGTPHGYKDACDRLRAVGVLAPEPAERLKHVFDVGDRVRLGWSTLAAGELAWACSQGADALEQLAFAAERLFASPRSTLPV